MTTLTLDLAPELYERLRAEAERQHRSVEAIAQEWLTEQLATVMPAPMSDRDRTTEALRAAGLLVEPSPEMLELAEGATMTLEEVSAALDRAGGKPLSEIVLEQRGPKE